MSRPAPRKARKDSLRNRERLIEAAKIVFGTGEPDATLEAVARKAGMGIGTLYRHFPTREALYAAVYRNDVDDLARLAERLVRQREPVKALRDWIRPAVAVIATKKGMRAALSIPADSRSELHRYCERRLIDAIDSLLDRAVAAGAIRDRVVSADDLLRSLVGMCSVTPKPDWPRRVARLMDVLVDGLLAVPPSTRPPVTASRGATGRHR